MTELNELESLRERVVSNYNKISPILKKKAPEKMTDIDNFVNQAHRCFVILNSDNTNNAEKEKYKQKYSNILNTLDSQLEECNARYCSA